ncbi:MAG: thiosulfate oxidation carrier protein SoxY [Methylococcales bacterium]|nr:thiosulfate oxidation carrier protein SoxY [Methylococcales bacterium]
MLKNRRQFIKKILSIAAYSLALPSGFLRPSLANAEWQKEKFQPKDYAKIIEHLYGNTQFIESKKIKFSRLPKVAENGAVVPISISSTLKKVTKISILVENNPHPLIAEFYLSPAVAPHVSARIKMAKTSDVIVIVEAEGKLYRKTQFVKVTKGGCG